MALPLKASLSPDTAAYLIAANARLVVDFVETAFHGRLVRMKERDDASILHAELRIGDSVVMVADETDDFPAVPVWMHVYVSDVDDTYQRALAAGAKSVMEPGVRGPGEERRGGVKDPAGNVWWIAARGG